jgi:hypothetical protein
MLVLLSVLGANVLYWLVTNVAALTKVPGIGPWVEPTTLAAEIGLTLGTLVLAAAALAQSRAAGIQLEVAGKQAGRDKLQTEAALLRLKPHLDFQVVENPQGPTTQDTFVLHPDRWFINVRLRNVGMGPAIDVQVTSFRWMVSAAGLAAEIQRSQTGGGYRGPTPTPPFPIPSDIINVPFSLNADEHRDFAIQVEVPPPSPPSSPPPQPITGFLEQVVVVAWAKTLRGEEIPPIRLGLRLQSVYPAPSGATGGRAALQSIWSWLSDDELASIPGVPSERTSWRTMVAASRRAPPVSP